MPSIQKTLLAKFQEAEQLAAQITMLPKESEDGSHAILRWAVVGDEVQRLMIRAEELLSPVQLARLKAEINGTLEEQIDRWQTYRESEWRLPKFGAPGPLDDPPPLVPIRDLF